MQRNLIIVKNHQGNGQQGSLLQSFNFLVWKTLDIYLLLFFRTSGIFNIPVHKLKIVIVMFSFDDLTIVLTMLLNIFLK